MTWRRLIWRSAVYYLRSHLGALLGACVGASALVGALAVGDSVRGTLRDLAAQRTGKAYWMISTGERLFTDRLAVRIQAAFGPPGSLRGSRFPVAALLALPASAARPDGGARAGEAQVYGVNGDFWRLALEPPPFPRLPPDGAALNRALANRLGAAPGDEVILRVRKPSALSRDAPITPVEDVTRALRLRVSAVVSDRQMGRFDPRSGRREPLNAFVPLELLQRRVNAPGRANLLLAGIPARTSALSAPQQAAAIRTNLPRFLDRVLRRAWSLEDAQMEWRVLPAERAFELRTPRVFLDPVWGRTVLGDPDRPSPFARRFPRVRPTGVLTYFVNEIRLGTRAAPYSMVAAADPPLAPESLRPGEIMITKWLAEDLGARPGDRISLRYYLLGAGRELVETNAAFRVKGVVSLAEAGWNAGLTPDFPGITKAANCRDWDTGLPIQWNRIRPKDEEYWRRYRAAPKAMIRLAEGRRLWSNRFGDLTAIRFHYAGPALGIRSESQWRRLLGSLRVQAERWLAQQVDPAEVGLRFDPIGGRARAGADKALDYGRLFLGFSFFLIAAAGLLVALLFALSVERRAREVGALLAMGFTRRQVQRLFALEGGLAALAGSALGVWGGTFYARAMLAGLSTVWRGGVGGTPLAYYARLQSLLIGFLAAWLIAWLAMAATLRGQSRRSPRALLAEGEWEEMSADAAPRRSGRAAWAAGILFAAAAGLLIGALLRRESAGAGTFFGAGACLLGGCLAALAAWIAKSARASSARRLRLSSLALRGLVRRRRRSLGTIALLSCGSFLIASIGVFRLETPAAAKRRDSGAGGFDYIGKAAQPILNDLGKQAAWETYALDPAKLEGTIIVSGRVREGERADCLNLNRVLDPEIIGVDQALLARLKAFRFVRTARGVPRSLGWAALDPEALAQAGVRLGSDEVPAAADLDSILWSLGKKVGDSLTVRDARGRAVKLRLVAATAHSILQGQVFISEKAFLRLFPDIAGRRWFLIDAPDGREKEVAEELTRGLEDYGFEVVPTLERLAALNAVQNTYLGTFQALGALGLLLGSLGLGVVVARNVFERRGELALLQAVGFSRPLLKRWIWLEHLALLALGMGVGVLSGAIAVAPTVAALGVRVPAAQLAFTLGAVFFCGMAAVLLAAQRALRGSLWDILRNP